MDNPAFIAGTPVCLKLSVSRLAAHGVGAWLGAMDSRDIRRADLWLAKRRPGGALGGVYAVGFALDVCRDRHFYRVAQMARRHTRQHRRSGVWDNLNQKPLLRGVRAAEVLSAPGLRGAQERYDPYLLLP